MLVAGLGICAWILGGVCRNQLNAASAAKAIAGVVFLGAALANHQTLAKIEASEANVGLVLALHQD